MDADLLIHNALVLTLEAEAPPFYGGYVAIQGRRIVAVGQGGAQKLPQAREVLNAQGALVLPGLVNTHSHAPMVWFRGLADDLPLQRWLTEVIFPAESGWLTPSRVYLGAQLAAAEMIRGGTTTVADGYFYAGEVRWALAGAGLRGVVAQGVLDFPVPGVPDPKDNLKVAAHYLASGQAAQEAGIISGVFCHAAYTCGPETLRQAKELARKQDARFFMHLAETREEVDEVRRRTGLTPAAYLESLGVLDEQTVAVHAAWLTPEEIDLLARRGVKVSHCPESNLKLAAGVAPLPELMAAGVTVGLGTDGAASNNNLDLWGEMSLAARLHKVWRLDPTLLPAAQAVALATREGAKVLGLEDAVGTLTPGKEADLIVVDLEQPHLTPLYDPYSHLVYAARAADVRHVMVAGRWLLFDRCFTTLNWPEIAGEIRKSSRDLAGFRKKGRSPDLSPGASGK
jgi:5-methylthioadenosine/S-adenosylhomocysteine deaminase